MGIQVDISFLSSDYRLNIYKDLDHAIQSVMWMFKGLAPHEEPLLRDYFRRHFVKHSDGWTLSYQHIAKWALISWEK